jgi:hypothetical protein
MKKIIFGVFALAVLLLAGCSTITMPYKVTDNPVGSKTGEVTATFLFGQIYDDWFLHHSDVTPNNRDGYAGAITSTRFSGLLLPIGGDFTLSKAAANGGITKISTVEIRTETNPFIVKRTLIVTGN